MLKEDDDQDGDISQLRIANYLYIESLGKGVDRDRIDLDYRYFIDMGIKSTKVIEIEDEDKRPYLIAIYMN